MRMTAILAIIKKEGVRLITLLITHPPKHRSRDNYQGEGVNILIDLNFNFDPRVERLRLAHGAVAPGILLLIMIELRRTDGVIPKHDIDLVADRIRLDLDQTRDIINTSVGLGLLGIRDENLVCPEIEAQAAAYNNKVNSLKKAGSCGGLANAKANGRANGRANAKANATPHAKRDAKHHKVKVKVKVEDKDQVKDQGGVQRGELRGLPASGPVVYLSDAEIERLVSEFGKDWLKYWLQRAIDYARDKPADFNKHKDHNRCLRNWHRLELKKGFEWAIHPRKGPGYYRDWDIAKAKEQSGMNWQQSQVIDKNSNPQGIAKQLVNLAMGGGDGRDN